MNTNFSFLFIKSNWRNKYFYLNKTEFSAVKPKEILYCGWWVLITAVTTVLSKGFYNDVILIKKRKIHYPKSRQFSLSVLFCCKLLLLLLLLLLFGVVVFLYFYRFCFPSPRNERKLKRRRETSAIRLRSTSFHHAISDREEKIQCHVFTFSMKLRI